jgi:galactokinase/mevalonate kinase-like predicted kinase
VDLGVEERITTYGDLKRVGSLGSGFGIGKAALALAGFDPAFHAGGGYRSLGRQLESELGGGIELSMVCAIPKGSGLGTSSILAATVLMTLSDLCGLSWAKEDVVERTLALEQMLTAGGGWQDQVGGLFGGVKLVQTAAGLEQKPTIRWLPSSLFTEPESASTVLLYYTGIARVAHDILGEIVGHMFAGTEPYAGILESIGHNAGFAADAIQRNDRGLIAEAVRRSWQLNQRLDSGTNPRAIRRIVDAVSGEVDALKLLGAGGGGYMLMLARDAAAAGRIRRILSERPPNRHARFVTMTVSDRGAEVTRS